MTEDIITTGDIESAIEQRATDGVTVEEIRAMLDDINDDIVDWWLDHSEAIDDGAHEKVHEDRHIVVLADSSGHFWREQFDAMDVDDAVRGVVSHVQHNAARRVCDYSWSVADPVVIQKPQAFEAGEMNVLDEIARRTREEGSVARAVDQLVTEVYGRSKSQWARQTGRNPSSVTRTTQEK